MIFLLLQLQLKLFDCFCIFLISLAKFRVLFLQISELKIEVNVTHLITMLRSEYIFQKIVLIQLSL